MGEFIDFHDVKHEEMEIKISPDGKTIWINTEERCIFRLQNIKKLTVTDERSDDPQALEDEAVHNAELARQYEEDGEMFT